MRAIRAVRATTLRADMHPHFGGDYMTDMSSWMQGALDSVREVADAIHTRALVNRR